MRFMMLIFPQGYEKAEPGTLPELEGVEQMMAFNKALQDAGVLISLEGLHPPSMGARITFAAGKPTARKGPFPEVKEVVGGYWIIQVKSLDEAMAWASRCPASDNEIIELRQIQELEDFPPDIQQAASIMTDMSLAAGSK